MEETVSMFEDILQDLMADAQRGQHYFPTPNWKTWVLKEVEELSPNNHKEPYSLYERGDGYIVKISAPGVKKEDMDIKVQLLNGLHNIDVSIKKTPKEDLGKLIVTGLFSKTESSQSYSIKLNDINPDTVDATLELGILTITAAKAKKSAAVTVKVK
jgi:HSP20 family molecular chaperone IbpA